MLLVGAYATGNADDIAGRIIDHNDSRLQLLCASDFGDVAQVLIDFVNLRLNGRIDGCVNGIATAVDQIQIALPYVLIPLGNAIPLCQCFCHILNNQVHKVGINLLGSIVHFFGNCTAIGALDRIAGCYIGLTNALITTGFIGAFHPLIFGGNRAFQHQLLGHSLVVLLLSDIALCQHFAQHQQLTVTISLSAVHDLAGIFKFLFGVGVKQRRVVGNTDKAGAFRNGQCLQFFAEIGRRRTSDTAATLSQIDRVQILFDD